MPFPKWLCTNKTYMQYIPVNISLKVPIPNKRHTAIFEKGKSTKIWQIHIEQLVFLDPVVFMGCKCTCNLWNLNNVDCHNFNIYIYFLLTTFENKVSLTNISHIFCHYINKTSNTTKTFPFQKNLKLSLKNGKICLSN